MARLGLSVLSKDNIDVAYYQEVMCNKRTGEFLIKTLDGDAMSFQYFTRLREHELKTEKSGREYGLITRTGHDVDIYNIEVDELDNGNIIAKVLPDTISLDTDYIQTPIVIQSAVERFMISIDLDAVPVSIGGISQNLYEGITAEVVVSAYDSENVVLQTITITQDVTNISTKMNTFSPSIVSTIDHVSLESITFSRPTAGNTIRLVLHSVMIIVETVNV